jgi:hypothetical protein
VLVTTLFSTENWKIPFGSNFERLGRGKEFDQESGNKRQQSICFQKLEKEIKML